MKDKPMNIQTKILQRRKDGQRGRYNVWDEIESKIVPTMRIDQIIKKEKQIEKN